MVIGAQLLGTNWTCGTIWRQPRVMVWPVHGVRIVPVLELPLVKQQCIGNRSGQVYVAMTVVADLLVNLPALFNGLFTVIKDKSLVIDSGFVFRKGGRWQKHRAGGGVILSQNSRNNREANKGKE